MVENVDIKVDGFTFPFKVVVMEIEGTEKCEMILERRLLATANAIIDLGQGEIVIRSEEDFLAYKRKI